MMGGNIIVDRRLLMAYERLTAIGQAGEKTSEYVDGFWEEMLKDPELMEEFIYYLDNKTFQDKYKCRGYGLTDMYFLNLRKVEIKQDVGKNYADTDKYILALDTFLAMADMKKDPEKYIKQFEAGPGMDRFYD